MELPRYRKWLLAFMGEGVSTNSNFSNCSGEMKIGLQNHCIQEIRVKKVILQCLVNNF